jgi:hypothetical protein
MSSVAHPDPEALALSHMIVNLADSFDRGPDQAQRSSGRNGDHPGRQFPDGPRKS